MAPKEMPLSLTEIYQQIQIVNRKGEMTQNQIFVPRIKNEIAWIRDKMRRSIVSGRQRHWFRKQSIYKELKI